MSEASPRRYGFRDPKLPEDLERLGRSLAAGPGEEAARRIGAGVWLGWCQDIEEERKHPSNRYLAAFLRGFSVPLAGWLPKGMAEYLAERMANPKSHQPRKGGRPRARDRAAKNFPGKALAREALLYGEDETVARTGKHQTDVTLALHRHKKAVLDSLEVDLLNTRYPLPKEEAQLVRDALAREGRNSPPETPPASD